jgi:hypothetical protein
VRERRNRFHNQEEWKVAKLAQLIAIGAVVFGMPTAAYAQGAVSPHLHAPQPATAIQPAPAQLQQKAEHEVGCQCPCCQAMQMMKPGGDASCMQKMKMMQDQGAQEKPGPAQKHEKH